jgi:aminopeptidase YwaD
MKKLLALLAGSVFLFVVLNAVAGDLLPADVYQIIRANSSGQRPFADFGNLAQFSGFSPSAGADQIANYLADRAKSFGMANVNIEHFPSDGKTYMWAFRTEPYWEGKKGELWLEGPNRQLLASFAAQRIALARLSRNTNVGADLIYIGGGLRDEDYAGKSVDGKIVLTTGPLSGVLREAVWKRKALGIVYFSNFQATDYPDLLNFEEPKPWEGPHGEQTTFAFCVTHRVGEQLRDSLAAGEKLVVHAVVEAEIGKGSYPVVAAEIPGSDPTLPAVLVYAHTNSRTSGGNNLSGIGCTLEMARELSGLIQSGQLPRPRRTIRFMWGPEHFGMIAHFHAHPDDISNLLAMINVDMIGFNQQLTKAVFHLYRAPYSRPTFLDDIVEELLEKVGTDNTISIRYANPSSASPSEGFRDPLFDPMGTREDYRYNVEKFWGPSDHEDSGEASIGLPAILLNDFPDVFLGTQKDTAEVGDPTQMRRGVVVATSSAYMVASAAPRDLPALIQNGFTNAKSRLAADEMRGYSLLRRSTAASLAENYRDAQMFLRLDYAREIAALNSLSSLVGEDAFTPFARNSIASLASEEALALDRLRSSADDLASTHNISLSSSKPDATKSETQALTPERDLNVRGPVHFFRPEYGRWWLIEKSGDEHFEDKVLLSRRGSYVLYETLNFANGRRSVAEIRDLISDEFEPIPIDEVMQYFKFLDSVGVVHLKKQVAVLNN